MRQAAHGVWETMSYRQLIVEVRELKKCQSTATKGQILQKGTKGNHFRVYAFFNPNLLSEIIWLKAAYVQPDHLKRH